MDHYESNEGPTSITESSQEWHILNLLRVCERDLFETNLQEFRKIQLTESQDGKVRLCKLINEVLRLDPQYSIILVEDLSHLFNDNNFVVQKYALSSVVDLFSILFSYIASSNRLLESLTSEGGYSESHMKRCIRSSLAEESGQKVNGVNHVNKSGYQTTGEVEESLPFRPENKRVFESFADLACIRFMVHTRLMEASFEDVKYMSLHSLPNLIYNRTKVYSVNLVKALFYELANYPNYLCNQCTKEFKDHYASSVKGEKEEKTTKEKGAKDKKTKSKTKETKFDLYDTMYRWQLESVQLLQSLMANYIRSERGKDKQGNKSNRDESKLVGSVLGSEVACCLITFYPEYYFDSFSNLLVDLLGTTEGRVFETILFRVFANSNSYNYHHLLLEKVKKYGYEIEMEDVYKVAQTLPSRFKEVHKGTMVVVDKDEEEKDKHFNVTDKLVTSLKVEPEERLQKYPAAQIFEFDKELVRNYKNIKNSQIQINSNFYKHKPVEVTKVEYPEPYEEYREEFKGKKDKLEKGKEDKYKSYKEVEEKELKKVSELVIRENEKLFVRLVGCQMIDTTVSYQRFLRFEVISPKVTKFDTFARSVMNRFLVSNLVEFDKRKEVLRNLLNYLAEYVLVNHGEGNFFQNKRLREERAQGLQALFVYVKQEREVDLFVKYLNQLNQLVVYSYTTNLAKSLVTNKKNEKNKVKKENEDDEELGELQEFEKEGEEDYMDLYEKFVTMCLGYVCEYLSTMEEFGDFCVNALSRFVLNLPKVPNRISELIVYWVESEEQGNVKLAFSLVSNLLKLPGSFERAETTSLLKSEYNRYTSNLRLVRRSIFVVFLKCITSKTKGVANIFLRLISSQKGLYNNTVNYTLKSHEESHKELVEKLKELSEGKSKEGQQQKQGEVGGEEEQEEIMERYEDCMYLSDRPLWQWPEKLVEWVHRETKMKVVEECLRYSEKKYDSLLEENGQEQDRRQQDDDEEQDAQHKREQDYYYYYGDDEQEEVHDDIGSWIEESVALMARPNSVKTSKFVKGAVNELLKCNNKEELELKNKDKDKETRQDMEHKGEPMELEQPQQDQDYTMDLEEDDDEAMIIVDDDEDVDEKQEKERERANYEKYVFFEPMLSCCIKNSRMVFRLSKLANELGESEYYEKCSKTLSRYPKELQLMIKYEDKHSPFIERVLEETRKSWCDVLFKFEERTTLEKNLMNLLVKKMDTIPEYLIQMSPFLSPEQLDKLMVSLFEKYEKEKLVKILDVIIETPKIALPQHFLYSTYNLPVGTLSPGDKEKDYMKLQVSLLDTCIKYCTLGRFSVESAISSLYLIVESFENINFVFGRLLVQFVQKIPLTRKVIVDLIFPKLVQKQCWQDKQLFKGVVITIGTLWNQFKDQLLRYILEMPNSNIKTVLKALQSQYNIAEYFKTVSLPSNVHTILEDVLSTTPSSNK